MDGRPALLATMALVVVSVGCLGFVLGGEPLRFTASEATVENDTRDGAGYRTINVTEERFDRTFSIAGQSRRVIANTVIARYGKRPGAVGTNESVGAVAIVSTPAIEVNDETLNPLGRASASELAESFQSTYGGVNVSNASANTTIETLGTTTNVTQFPGEATVDGTTVDVYVEVMRVQHGDDFVVGVGIYPRAVAAVERPEVLSMFGAIDHRAGDG